MQLMIKTSVDYTLFFRELSHIPEDITPLTKSFYNSDFKQDEMLMKSWSAWLEKWKLARTKLAQEMKQVNPKYTLREWFLVPAYKKAEQGDYTLLRELQEIMTNPYDEQSLKIEEKYYRKKPSQLFDIAGISHVSCSS